MLPEALSKGKRTCCFCCLSDPIGFSEPACQNVTVQIVFRASILLSAKDDTRGAAELEQRICTENDLDLEKHIKDFKKACHAYSIQILFPDVWNQVFKFIISNHFFLLLLYSVFYLKNLKPAEAETIDLALGINSIKIFIL